MAANSGVGCVAEGLGKEPLPEQRLSGEQGCLREPEKEEEEEEEKPHVSSNGGKEEKAELFKNLAPKKRRMKKLQ